MSNIGKPIRELWLEKTYGRKLLSTKSKINMFYGDLIENAILVLLRASGCTVEGVDKKVELQVNGVTVKGEMDAIIDDAYWDIKSASKYSFTHKFTDFNTLVENDDFGYVPQNEGYARAEGIPNGGWIVFNKEDGRIKVVEAPERYEPAYEKIKETVKFFTMKNPEVPPCPGIEEETWYGKKTGRIKLNDTCRFCDYKEECHPGIQYRPTLIDKSKSKDYVWYIKVNEGE
jgi:hypothetical protein